MKKKIFLALAVAVVFVSLTIQAQPSQWVIYNTSNSGLPTNFLNTVSYSMFTNEIWIGCAGGAGIVWYSGGGSWPVDNNGCANTINSIAIDNSNLKWIGTQECVIRKTNSGTSSFYAGSSALPSNAVKTTAIAQNDSAWIGTNNGLARFDDVLWDFIVYNVSNAGLPSNNILSLAADNNGKKWVGTDNGLAVFTNTTQIVYDTSTGLPSNTIQAITIYNQYKWVGTNSGIAVYNDTSWTIYNTGNGLPSNNILSIVIDINGTAWVGTDNGLASFDGVSWFTYNTSNSDLPNNTVNSIVIADSSHKWIATYGGGLAVYKGDHGQCMTSETINPIACGSYVAASGNYTWTSSGIYMDTVPNTAGCDSIITVNLTINTADTSLTQAGNILVSNANGATYQWLDCTNGDAAISGEIAKIFTATANGNYAVEITQNGCIDTSACYAITSVGIQENAFGDRIRVFPNPITGKLSIDLGQQYTNITIKVKTVTGQVISNTKYASADKVILAIDGAAGLYFVKILTTDGKFATLKVVKD